MKNKVIRIHGMIKRARTKSLLKALKTVGVRNIHVAAGRAPVLEAPSGIMRILSGKNNLTSHPVDFVSFFTHPADESKALDLVVYEGHLHLPGQGSVYSQELELNDQHPLCRWQELGSIKNGAIDYYDNLTGINCVVQRGAGDQLARVILESGSGVPTITYGVGTGVRDKLGLLRITIPADKEVLSLVTTSWDADEVMEKMIVAGKLDQPGKGFINTFDIKQGIINTKVSSTATKHAADMEQIIAALDKLQGGMEWRREASDHSYSGVKRAYFGGRDLQVICNDGYGVSLVQAAMKGGAAGATIEKLSLRDGTGDKNSGLSRAREVCKMMVPDAKINDIVSAMCDAGALKDQAQAMIFNGPVSKAFTYIKAS